MSRRVMAGRLRGWRVAWAVPLSLLTLLAGAAQAALPVLEAPVRSQSAEAFNRASFKPAILSLSFTQDKGNTPASEQAANAFLDITLIPPEGEPIGQRVELERARFQELLRTLYRQLARQESLQVQDPASPSRQLYDALIGPIAGDLQRLQITTLLIAADRGLQAVPFAALHSGRVYLGQAMAFSVAGIRSNCASSEPCR